MIKMSFTVERRRQVQGSRQQEEAIECDALTFGEQSGRRLQKTFSRISFGFVRCLNVIVIVLFVTCRWKWPSGRLMRWSSQTREGKPLAGKYHCDLNIFAKKKIWKNRICWSWLTYVFFCCFIECCLLSGYNIIQFV